MYMYMYTVLHDACRNGHLDITQYLITELNCHLSPKNKYGNTPLHTVYSLLCIVQVHVHDAGSTLYTDTRWCMFSVPLCSLSRDVIKHFIIPTLAQHRALSRFISGANTYPFLHWTFLTGEKDAENRTIISVYMYMYITNLKNWKHF